MLSRVPPGVALCLSAVLACGVLLLQHAESYACQLEGKLHAWAVEAPDLLRHLASVTGATAWQAREKEVLAACSAVPYLGAASEAATVMADEELPEEVEPGEVAVPLPQEEPGKEVVVAPEPPPVVRDEARTDVLPAPEQVSAAVPETAGEEAAGKEGMEPPRQGRAKEPSLWERGQKGLQWGMAATRQALETMAEYRRTHPDEFAVVPQELAPVSEEPEKKEPMPLPEKLFVQCRIMMVGDSLMEGLGPVMHRSLLNRKGLEIVVSAKYSTGLCRPDIFDWPATMRHVVSTRKPDIVIFFMGANDGQPIKEGNHFVQTGGKAWRDAYARKMDELVSIAKAQGAEVIWVELPAVGGRYSRLLHENQIAQREYCEQSGITSLQTDPIFSGVFGRFESYGDYKGKHVRLRTKDLTHLTEAGNKKLVEELMPILDGKLSEFYQKNPDKRLTEEQAAKLKRVQAFYTIKYEPPKRRRRSR